LYIADNAVISIILGVCSFSIYSVWFLVKYLPNPSYCLQGNGENDFTHSVIYNPRRLVFTQDVRVNLKSRPGTALIIYKKMINNKIEKKPQNANYYRIEFVMQIFIWLWVNVTDLCNTIAALRKLYVVLKLYHIKYDICTQ